MSHPIPTIRVKTSAADNEQGFFLINESDFDEKVHERFEGSVSTPVAVPPGVTREYLNEELAKLPNGQTDPDHVVNSMREYFGELFTAADEAAVRGVVKTAAGKLPIAELRAYLDGKGIAYDPAAKKAGLQALYDADKGV